MADDSEDGDSDDPLENGDKERLDRVRGKRDARPSRARHRRPSRTQQEEQAPQGQQSQEGDQPPQAQQGEQASREDEKNHQQESAQAQQAPQETMDTQAQNSTEEKQAQQAQQAKLEPVTKREHDTFYLDENVRAELNRIYRRVALDVLEETGVDIEDQSVGGRNRYFRPLALLLGARELQEMTPEELRKTIEEEGLVDDLPAEE
ncbi:hypothetical protein ACYJ1Y_16115 [Natrialbaceae archaeon A-gly3]